MGDDDLYEMLLDLFFMRVFGPWAAGWYADEEERQRNAWKRDLRMSTKGCVLDQVCNLELIADNDPVVRSRLLQLMREDAGLRAYLLRRYKLEVKP